MGSYQLTLSPNYVPNWNVCEALRELFQNGIDRENETSGESKFSIIYDPLARRLILGNPDTCLHKRTLLLGETTKDGKSTIGKYGEGYKLALLVLLRLDCRITIENYNELWIPKLVKSRVFDAELIQIDTSKNKNCDGWLRYIIDGITPEHYALFQDQCLLFHTNKETVSTRYGDILLDPKYKGKVYCNTLFVCNIDGLEYGYNMHPQYIELDRDRKKVSEFNLTWETSRMWSEGETSSETIHQMMLKEKIDVAFYLTHASRSTEKYKDLCELQHKDFISKHGVNAVVCRDKEEADIIKAKYGNLVPVIVPEKIYTLVSDSSSYSSKAPDIRNENTPANWVKLWIERLPVNNTDLFSINDIQSSLDELIEQSEKWVYR